MFNYLLILNGKLIKGYKSLRCALNGYDRYLLRKNDRDYLELYSREEGLIQESF